MIKFDLEFNHPQAAELLAIAVKSFPSVETLAIQNMDGLDFHNVSVWGIRDALAAAFAAGQAAPVAKKRVAPVDPFSTPGFRDAWFR